MATDSPGFVPREGPGATVFDGKMWMMGGCGASTYFNDVWCSSDGINWSCTATSAPWSYRVSPGVTTFDGKMWMMGGGAYLTVGFDVYNDVWYSTDGTNWTCATSSAPWAPRMDHEVIVYDGKMWVIGGGILLTSTIYNDIWYSSDGVNWTCSTGSAPWAARMGHTCSLYNNNIWLMGGDGGSSPLNDVWSMATTGIAEEESLVPRGRITVFPNPSAGSVEIAFTLPADAEVRVDIFDTSGRTVRCLSDGMMSSGSHTVFWDGRDGSGSKPGAGIYFVKIQSDDSTSCKMVTLW